MTEQIELGETRKVTSYDPYTGKEIEVRIVVENILVNSNDICMARCVLTETGQQIDIPVTDLVCLNKVKSNQAILIQIRKRIGRIDRQIVRLLAKRLELVAAAAKIKKDLGRSVEDGAQESRVEEHIRSLASEFFLDFNNLWIIFQEVVKWSKQIQSDSR